MLLFKLMGDFTVTNQNQNVRLRGRKARAMLAYLAVSGSRSVHRERAADLLWSDRATEQARGSLRQTVAEMRACPEIDAAIFVARDALGLIDSAFTTDINIVLAAAERRDASALAEGIATMGECFLGDLVGTSPAFDDWLLVERVRQHERIIAAVSNAITAMIGHATPMVIQEILRALDRLDPCNEAIARLGLETDHAAGDVAAVHRRYRRLCNQLTAELGVDPSVETQQLFERLALTSVPAKAAEIDDRAPLTAKPPTLLITPIEPITDGAQIGEIARILSCDIGNALMSCREIRIVNIASGPQSIEQGLAGAIAAYVLSGKIRQLGDDIRVNLQLGNIEAGTVVWAEQLVIAPDDLASSIDRCVAKAAGAIIPAVDIDLAAMPAIVSYSGNDDIMLFAKARRQTAVGCNLDDIRAGVKLLEELIERNPRHVQAINLLAQLYNTDFWFWMAGHDVSPFRARALDLARRASAIEPTDARQLLRLSWCHLRSGHWERAERGFREVSVKLPYHAGAINECAFGMCHAGDLETAEPLMQRAFALNPFAPAHYHADYAVMLMLHRDASPAEEHFAVCGERLLLYRAARLANASYLTTMDRAEHGDLLADFTDGFLNAWQLDRSATVADVLVWVADALPLRRPEHAIYLADGLSTALGSEWRASRRTIE